MERDDLIVNDSYAANATHSEEDGVKIRRNIWKVTGILTALTFLEVMMGIYFKRSETFTWEAIKWSFIVLTLVKAGYIVMVFMHLGEERKNLRRIILVPYAIFVLYLIFIALSEGLSHFDLWETWK